MKLHQISHKVLNKAKKRVKSVTSVYKTYPLRANAFTRVQRRRSPSPEPENLSLVQTAALWRSHHRRSLKRREQSPGSPWSTAVELEGMECWFSEKKSHWKQRQAACTDESGYLRPARENTGHTFTPNVRRQRQGPGQFGIITQDYLNRTLFQ